MSITQWPKDQRPREKLIKLGAGALSDAELLAIALRVGVKGKSAVALGGEILRQFGSLQQLFLTPIDRFCQVGGLGPAKYSLLQAVLELAKRALNGNLQQGINLNAAQNVKNYLQLLIGNKTYESFAILFLDVKLRLIACEELFHGSLTNTRVYPREIVKRALHYNAASIILAHNHPSGQTIPSQADIILTSELKKICQSVEINVLDHFVVVENKTFSFAEHGLMQ